MSQPFRLNKEGLINRNKKISFTFNGKKLFGYEGDTIASALIANGIHVFHLLLKQMQLYLLHIQIIFYH